MPALLALTPSQFLPYQIFHILWQSRSLENFAHLCRRERSVRADLLPRLMFACHCFPCQLERATHRFHHGRMAAHLRKLGGERIAENLPHQLRLTKDSPRHGHRDAAPVGKQPPARAVCPHASRPYAIDPVPAIVITPGPLPNAASSVVSRSLTTRMCPRSNSRIIPATASRTSGRPAPDRPMQAPSIWNGSTLAAAHAVLTAE